MLLHKRKHQRKLKVRKYFCFMMEDILSLLHLIINSSSSIIEENKEGEDGERAE
jgi:hypothetical protein